MKRRHILTLVLALILALIITVAGEAQVRDIDFGDFTLTMDPNMPGKIFGKAENQNLAKMYPAYLAEGDDKTYIIITFFGTKSDLSFPTDDFMKWYADVIRQSILTGTAGIYDFSLYEDRDFTAVTLDGRPGFSFVTERVWKNVEDGPDGPETHTFTKYYIVEAEDGEYGFDTTTDSMEKIEKYSEPIVWSLKWKSSQVSVNPSVYAEPQTKDCGAFSITYPGDWESVKDEETGAIRFISPEGNSVLISEEGPESDYTAVVDTGEGKDRLSERISLERDAIKPVERKTATGRSEYPVTLYLNDGSRMVGGEYSVTATMKDDTEKSIYGKIMFLAKDGAVYSFNFVTNREKDIEELFDPMLKSVEWK